MAIESQAGFMSLAELAAMQTDEIQTLTSRNPDAGIYIVKGTGVTASQSDPRTPEEAPLFSFGFEAEILQADLVDKAKDVERLVGRKLRERYTLWPTDFREAIGLLKGRYQIVGLPNVGALGGVEGQNPGWLDGMINHIFKLRVRAFTDSKGVERVGFDWMKYEAPGGQSVVADSRAA